MLGDPVISRREELTGLLHKQRIDFNQACIPSILHFDLQSLEALHASEERHFWSASKRYLVNRLIRRYARTEDFSLLDVGCGNGGLLRSVECVFPRATVAGLDGYPEALLHCRERTAKARLFLWDINSIEAISAAPLYDVITVLDVLEHLDHPQETVRSLTTLLRPGGILIVTVPALQFLWSSRDVFLGHRKRYAKRELAAMLRGAELTVLRSNYCFSYLVPPAFLHRKLLASHHCGEAIEKRELKEIPVVNDVLRFLGIVEICMSLALPLPFGTSTYCVAVKK